MPSIVFDSFKGGLDRRIPQTVGGANVQYVLNNAHITTGGKIRKRPCLLRTATLEPGTKGLKAAGGKLNTFYESGTITHADTRFTPNKVPHPTLSQLVTKAHYAELFNGFLYCAVEYADGSVFHHYLDGTVPPRVTDVNCPHSKQVEKLSQKIYAAAGPNVRFTKTADPRDWTTANDAGSIAAGTQAAGSDTVTAIGEFKSDLAIFFSDSTQVWDVDSDPANNALKSTADNVGTIYSKCSATLAGDLIFLAKQGFRSVSLTALTNNLQENDVGSAIDKLRNEIADADDPISVYYPALGQLWKINGNKAYVYSFARSVKLSAWSVFTFPVTIEAATVLASELYLRAGDICYIVDKDTFNDNGVIPVVEVEMFFQDNKSPGMLKQFSGYDGVVVGSPQIAFRFSPNTPVNVTDYIQIEGDMRAGDLFPLEVCATSIAPIFRHELDEEFELESLQLYYNNLSNL